MSNRPNPKKPSSAQKRVTTSRGRTVAAQRRRASSNRTMWIIGGVAAVVLVALIVAVVVAQSGSSNKAGTADADPAAISSQVVGVTDATITAVGQGSVTTLPTAVTAPALTKDGKPLVVYIGAEFCPYCAAQRWPMVQALSRFGSFSGLTLTHSSPDDVFPNTPTFTFHGASFSSADFVFQGVETQTVDRQPLDDLTADQKDLISKYDAPPYVPAASKGSIPFIDFGGSYVLSGALYSPQVLAGMTPDEVAGALSDPSSPVAQGIVGAANVITATICTLTSDQPSNVCGNSAVAAIEAKIKAQNKVA